MMINIYEELAANKMYRRDFHVPQTPGIPQEVRSWPDYLQESFCVLSVWHTDEGFDLDEADRIAIEQVKKSAAVSRMAGRAKTTLNPSLVIAGIIIEHENVFSGSLQIVGS